MNHELENQGYLNRKFSEIPPFIQFNNNHQQIQKHFVRLDHIISFISSHWDRLCHFRGQHGGWETLVTMSLSSATSDFISLYDHYIAHQIPFPSDGSIDFKSYWSLSPEGRTTMNSLLSGNFPPMTENILTKSRLMINHRLREQFKFDSMRHLTSEIVGAKQNTKGLSIHPEDRRSYMSHYREPVLEACLSTRYSDRNFPDTSAELKHDWTQKMEAEPEHFVALSKAIKQQYHHLRQVSSTRTRADKRAHDKAIRSEEKDGTPASQLTSAHPTNTNQATHPPSQHTSLAERSTRPTLRHRKAPETPELDSERTTAPRFLSPNTLLPLSDPEHDVLVILQKDPSAFAARRTEKVVTQRTFSVSPFLPLTADTCHEFHSTNTNSHPLFSSLPFSSSSEDGGKAPLVPSEGEGSSSFVQTPPCLVPALTFASLNNAVSHARVMSNTSSAPSAFLLNSPNAIGDTCPRTLKTVHMNGQQITGFCPDHASEMMDGQPVRDRWTEMMQILRRRIAEIFAEEKEKHTAKTKQLLNRLDPDIFFAQLEQIYPLPNFQQLFDQQIERDLVRSTPAILHVFPPKIQQWYNELYVLQHTDVPSHHLQTTIACQFRQSNFTDKRPIPTHSFHTQHQQDRTEPTPLFSSFPEQSPISVPPNVSGEQAMAEQTLMINETVSVREDGMLVDCPNCIEDDGDTSDDAFAAILRNISPHPQPQPNHISSVSQPFNHNFHSDDFINVIVSSHKVPNSSPSLFSSSPLVSSPNPNSSSSSQLGTDNPANATPAPSPFRSPTPITPVPSPAPPTFPNIPVANQTVFSTSLGLRVGSNFLPGRLQPDDLTESTEPHKKAKSKRRDLEEAVQKKKNKPTYVMMRTQVIREGVIGILQDAPVKTFSEYSNRIGVGTRPTAIVSHNALWKRSEIYYASRDWREGHRRRVVFSRLLEGELARLSRWEGRRRHALEACLGAGYTYDDDEEDGEEEERDDGEEAMAELGGKERQL
ncbi:hypothetical protein BLNAU_15793 [Blattamonas nauphoetae]|uniref:Uncharacterized protein n=1 Tax=Blattamonas nauphoetae TaxID=2049346 RepID=A0ABQ9X9T8_9EUKA|nr:hypothetical protein BLNAU_15793 [Blattamonas nauphoetae]